MFTRKTNKGFAPSRSARLHLGSMDSSGTALRYDPVSRQRCDRRAWEVLVCVLALAVALAGPGVSVAWAAGGHVTAEQAALHHRAIEHGHADHHGGADTPLCDVCSQDSIHASAGASAGSALQQLRTGAASGWPGYESVCSAGLESWLQALPHAAERLAPFRTLPFQQVYTRPALRPPIGS